MFQDFHELPALERGKRAGFTDTHLVADLGGLVLVVSIELLALLHDLLEHGVRNAGYVLHNDGLGHLGGDNNADACLTKALGLGRSSFFAHILSPWVFVCLGLGAALALNGQGAGEFLADDADALVVLQLAGGLLDAQVEVFLAQTTDVGGELLGGHTAEVFSFLYRHNNVMFERLLV